MIITFWLKFKRFIKQLLGYYLALFTLILEIIMLITIILLPLLIWLRVNTNWWDDPIENVMAWW